jgi:hypothetical protein
VKRIFLHIGAPKTGTSSIQDFCRQNAGTLGAHGLWYPLLDVKTKTIAGKYRQPAAHHLLADALRPENPRRARRKGTNAGADLFGPLLDDFAASPQPDMLLSAETFFQHARSFARSRVPAALSAFNLTVICYVRRSDEFVESLYKTVIVGHARYIDSIDQFARRSAPNYPDRLGAFLNVVPANNIVLRSYDEQRDRLLEDFLAAVLGRVDDDLRTLFPERRKNTSLGAGEVLFLRHLNRCAVRPEDFVQVRRAFRSVELARDDRSLMTPELRKELISAYNEDIAILNRDYGATLPAVPWQEASSVVADTIQPSEVLGVLDALRDHLPEPTWARLQERFTETADAVA